eukprot:scaffold5566_cov128-Isochrysis_galbana.AAC.1
MSPAIHYSGLRAAEAGLGLGGSAGGVGSRSRRGSGWPRGWRRQPGPQPTLARSWVCWWQPVGSIGLRCIRIRAGAWRRLALSP